MGRPGDWQREGSDESRADGRCDVPQAALAVADVAVGEAADAYLAGAAAALVSEREGRLMAHPLTRPGSRSVVHEKVDELVRLTLEVIGDRGASREADAARLREISRLAMVAADLLDPRELLQVDEG